MSNRQQRDAYASSPLGRATAKARHITRMTTDPDYAARFRFKIKNSKHKKKYGVGLRERDSLLEAQGGTCAIEACLAPITFDRTSHGANIDHCHKTGRRRGVLCGGCNKGLGHFADSPERLEAAAAYLRRHA